MATGTTIGHIEQYRPENELFSYLERLEQFFIANDIQDKATFLSLIGSQAYSLLKNLVSSTLPKDKSYADLVAALKQHYEPKPLVIAERFHFHRRSQAVGESINEYMAKLRRLSTHCKFKAFLDEALRDRLVCGLCSEAIQKKLLTEAELSLTKAIDLSVGMEAAEKNAKSLKETETAVNQVTPSRRPCYRCGRNSHDQKDCKFRDTECHNCGKCGHITPVCRSPKKSQTRRNRPTPVTKSRNQAAAQRYVTTTETPESEGDHKYLPLHTVGGGTTPPIKVPLVINETEVTMELDTGAAVTIISEKQLKLLSADAPLRKSELLRTYSGERLSMLGTMDAKVQYEQQTKELPLTVVAGDGPSLLGRDWLQHLVLNWREIKAVSKHDVGSLEYLLEKYGDLFKDKLGTITSFQAELHVKPEDRPNFFKPRSVPYALRGPIEEELDRLEREGIVDKVTHSEWATPLVAVLKPDGRVQLRGDFKVTVNPSLSVDQYPLPKVNDLLASLAGGKKFTKLDLTQAYLQLALHPESKKYCTINTHRGLYQYNCLPFGIASAPTQFQKVMDTILQGVPGAMCYIDDIISHGSHGRGTPLKLGGSFPQAASPWYSNEKEQMLLHARLSCLPRSPSGC